MVSRSVSEIGLVVLLLCISKSCNFVETLPSTVIQDEQQQAEQVETNSENFFDEVRHLIEQKLGASEAATDHELTTTESSIIVNSDEHAVQTTVTPVINDRIRETVSTIKSPKPVQVTDWPKLDLRLGQVVAVSIGLDGHPVIFHRADRIWTDE